MNNKVVSYRSKIFDIKSVNRVKARETLPIKTVTRMENARFIDGAFEITDYGEVLKHYTGIPIPPPPEVSSRVIPIIIYNQLRQLVAFGGDKTYMIKLLNGEPSWQVLIDAYCSSAVNIELNGEWAVMLSGINVNYTYDGSRVNMYPRSSVGIYEYSISHYGRIFAASINRKIYFSDESDPLNWDTGIDEGGFLGLDVNSGDIVGLESFNDYVYIFTEYNVYRLTAYAEQENFVLKKLDLDIGRIIAGSVAKCNGAVMFLTTRGLMAFDGYSARLISDDIRSDIDDSRIVTACGVGQKYYLSLDKKLHVYDYETNTIASIPIGFDFALSSSANFSSALLYTNYNILGDMGNTLYLYSDKPGRGKIAKPVLVETGEFDFGRGAERKVIRSISLREGIIGTIFITADGKEHCYNIGGQKRLDIGLSGRVFAVRMECYPFDKPLPSPTMEYGIEVI